MHYGQQTTIAAIRANGKTLGLDIVGMITHKKTRKIL